MTELDDENPIERFLALLEQAHQAETHDPVAVALATADAEGRPGVRIVLLRGADERGFVFFTNYGSRKAADLTANPQAALCFYWPSLQTQVRAEGGVEKIDALESDRYFAGRPRGHRIAAWVSRQSTPLDRRDDLLERYHQAELRFGDAEIPRPPFWGGYRLRPQRIEFWRGYENRLHDRVLYRREGDRWAMVRLNP